MLIEITGNTLLAIGVALGFYGGIDWLRYLTIGFVWLMLVVYCAQLPRRNLVSVRPENALRFWAVRTFDVAITFALANAGAYLTMLAYALSCFVLYAMLQRRLRPHALDNWADK